MFQSKTFFPFLGRNNPADNPGQIFGKPNQNSHVDPLCQGVEKGNTSGMAAFIEAVTPARASGEKASFNSFGSENLGL